jgi:hypothetical protein
MVYKMMLEASNEINNLKLDLRDWPAGFYWIGLYSKEMLLLDSKKLLKL